MLVSPDLLARSRLESAAREAGADLDVTDASGLLDALRERSPDLLVLDLDAGGRALLDRVGEARGEGIAPERLVGYFSHVDDLLGRAAQLAGVRAMPRGRFWRELRELLRD